MSNEILEVKGLKTVFTGKKGKVTAVDKISFSVADSILLFLAINCNYFL